MKKPLNAVIQFLRSRPRFDWVFFGIAIAVYLGLAIWNLTAGSIWFDEAFSAYLIQFNVIDIARYTATDVHPPFYYWLLKGWSLLFGTSEAGLRSMSIFFGVVTAVFAYLWTRRQFGRKAALIGLFILVLSPLFIRYSQEARMYTLSAALVFAATYVLTIALEAKRRSLWIIYGALVALGMLTHYFTALAWIAHWVWRLITVRQTGVKGRALFAAFFSKQWIIAYGLAIILYLPWAPAMFNQLLLVQSEGFWIGDVGVDTVGSYFGTLVYFLQSFQITGWFSAALIFMAVVTAILAVVTYRRLKKGERTSFTLLLCLAAVPPLLLFAASLPPLTPSFVERYLLPAAVASAVFMGVILAVGLRGQAIGRQVVIYTIIVAMLVSGLWQMYYYGNYNKNSRTGIETEQLVKQAIERAEPGEPIIVGTPWVFYEAVFYDSSRNPIYFVDEQVEYLYGSLDMLKYNDDHKIKDLDAFMREHPVAWYITYSDGEINLPRDSWTVIDKTSVTNRIDGKTVYRGVEVDAR